MQSSIALKAYMLLKFRHNRLSETLPQRSSDYCKELAHWQLYKSLR